ncbi:MAG: hypothetical protein ACRELB_12135, partial [Polyangiaceae bacterium]
LFVRTTLYAEVIVAQSASFEDRGTSRVGFSAFTAGSFGAGEVPDCGPGNAGRRLAVWDGMAPAGWTDDGVDVEMDEGDYDLATCEGAPKRTLRGRARAILPGYVYALRIRDEAEGAEEAREDASGEGSLLVLLPRAAMVSASADPSMPIATVNSGTFTRLTLPLSRGAAGTASVRLSPASLRLWSRLRKGGPPPPAEDPARVRDDVLLGVDVASEGQERFGSVTIAVPVGADRRLYGGLLSAAHLASVD